VCVLLGLVAMAYVPAPARGADRWSGGRRFNRTLLIVLENKNYGQVMDVPYFRQLATKGALFSDAHAITHPSYSNYIALVAGDTHGITDDRPRDLHVASIADLLNAYGLTWKNYAEGYPGNCSAINRQGRYDRKHVPFINFSSIRAKPERCANVVAAAQFHADRAANNLPNYAFYSPDRANDGHDTDLDYTASWLRGFLDPLLADATFMNGTLIIVTFDESDGDEGNQIYTLFLGPMVKDGYIEARRIDHYNVLRTIEENFNLGTLGLKDEAHDPIVTIWNAGRSQ
jgi:hypothetical protein